MEFAVGQQVAPGLVVVTVSSVMEGVKAKEERDKYKERLLEVEGWMRCLGKDIKNAQEAMAKTLGVEA